METTLKRKVQSQVMELIFDSCKTISIRYFEALDYDGEANYSPNRIYNYLIKIRHAEGTNASELLTQAIEATKKQLKSKSGN